MCLCSGQFQMSGHVSDFQEVPISEFPFFIHTQSQYFQEWKSHVRNDTEQRWEPVTENDWEHW